MSATLTELQPAGEGTCVQLSDTPPVWAVRGREDWHRCDADQGTCTCGDWIHRQARTLTPCRHLRMLTAYLLHAALVRRQFAAAAADEERAPLPSDADLRRLFR